MKIGELHAGDTKRGQRGVGNGLDRGCVDMWTMMRGEGCGVGNGLDRERVDVVVDDVDGP